MWLGLHSAPKSKGQWHVARKLHAGLDLQACSIKACAHGRPHVRAASVAHPCTQRLGLHAMPCMRMHARACVCVGVPRRECAQAALAGCTPVLSRLSVAPGSCAAASSAPSRCSCPVTLLGVLRPQDAERLESAKAAAAAAIGGAAASLPLALSEGTGAGAALLALATTGVASALLGVTYRYAVRQDVGNLQLKARRPACTHRRGPGPLHVGSASSSSCTCGGDACAGPCPAC